jgi:hypothetical protein
MAYTASQRNPFMLMMNPEVVLAAIEKSERLGQLNRQLCRPLDRIPPGSPEANADGDVDSVEDAESEITVSSGPRTGT